MGKSSQNVGTDWTELQEALLVCTSGPRSGTSSPQTDRYLQTSHRCACFPLTSCPTAGSAMNGETRILTAVDKEEHRGNARAKGKTAQGITEWNRNRGAQRLGLKKWRFREPSKDTLSLSLGVLPFIPFQIAVRFFSLLIGQLLVASEAEKNPQTVGTSYENMSKSSNFRSVVRTAVNAGSLGWRKRSMDNSPNL